MSAQRERQRAVDRRLGELLLEHGLLDPGRLAEGLARASPERPLARLVVDEGWVAEYAVRTLLAVGGDDMQPLAPTASGEDAPPSSALAWPSEVFAPAADGGLQPAALAAGPPAPNQTLGGYQVLGELGRGGGGRVYRAWDPRGEREVALKVLLHTSPQHRRRFQREVEAVRRLRHPLVVGLLDAGEERGLPFLVMELVYGRTLAELARPHGCEPRQAAAAIRDAARAIDYAHGQAVVHRDLKPANVIVDEAGRGRVLDFGLARLHDANTPLTKSDALLGTLPFMPPEQARCPAEALRPAVDVYGLGATLYYALTGRTPLGPQGHLAPSHPTPPPPSAARPGLPPALDRITLACLEREPARRYPSAGALADDLDRFLAGEPPRARGPGVLRRTWGTARSSPGLLSALAASAILALAGLGSLAWRAAQRPAPHGGAGPAAAAADAAARAVARELLAAAAAGEDPAALAGDAARCARSPAAAALFAERLDEVSAALDRARRAALLEVREPDASERTQGGGVLTGLPAALDAWAREAGARDAGALDAGALDAGALDAGALDAGALDAGALDAAPPLTPEQTRLLAAAARRLVARALRADPGALPRTAGELLAERQGAALGAGALREARLACAALGRSGWEGAAAPLARYLETEASEERAAAAAVALCRLGAEREGGLDPRITRSLLRACASFGPQGSLVRAVARALQREHTTLAPAHEPLDLLARGDLLLAVGDPAAALADYHLAAERAPTLALAWTRIGIAEQRRGRSAEALAAFDQALQLDPGASAARIDRAALRRRLGAPDGALQDLRRVIADDPSHAGAWRVLAETWQAQGELERARECFQQALALDPRDATARSNLGLTLRRLGRPREALAQLDAALELAPHEAQVWVNRGDLRADQGDLTGAALDCRRALELDPGSALARVCQSEVRRLRGDLAGARRAATRALELDPLLPQAWAARSAARLAADDAAGALQDAQRGLDLAPEDPALWIQRGAANQRLGVLPTAAHDYTRAAELDPTDPVPLSNLSALRYALGDYRAAVRDARAALDLDPAYTNALFNRSLAHQALGHPGRALADLRRLHELDPEHAPGWVNRGKLLQERGHPLAARRAFTRVIELDPNHAGAWSNRGALRYQAGDVTGALEDLTRAVQLDPRLAAAWANRALARKAAGDLPGALDDASRALALAPRSADYYANRASIHDARGDPAAALADLSRALDLAPRDPSRWAARGRYRQAEGDLAGAQADLDRALELAPQAPRPRFDRAWARQAAGDAAGAAADLEGFLELAPEHALAPLARVRLQRLREQLGPQE